MSERAPKRELSPERERPPERERSKGKTRGQDALGLLLAGLGGLFVVSIVQALLGGAARDELWAAPVVGLVWLVGHVPALALSAGLAGLGAWLFLRSSEAAAGRHLLGAVGLAFGLALALGALGPRATAWGGAVGEALPAALSGWIGVVLGVGLGLLVLYATSWLAWIGPRSRRSSEPEGNPGARRARPEAEDDGVSSAEAAALSESRPTAEPFAEPLAKPLDTGATTAGRAPDESRPPRPVLRPQPLPDVRLQGGVPAGTRPLEPIDAPPSRSTAAPLLPRGGTQRRPALDPASEPLGQDLAPPRASWQREPAEEPFGYSGGREPSGRGAGEAPRRAAAGLSDEATLGAPEAPSWEGGLSAFEEDRASDEEREPPHEVGEAVEAVEEDDLAPELAATAEPTDTEEPIEIEGENGSTAADEHGPASKSRPHWEQVGLFDADEPAALWQHEPPAPIEPVPEERDLAGTLEGAGARSELREYAEPPAAEDAAPEPEDVELTPAPRKEKARGGRKRTAARVESPPDPAPAAAGADPEDGLDPLVHPAGLLILEENRVAVSMLQRRFEIDFERACAILDQLQDRGLIGPYMGGRTRDILLTREEWASKATPA